MATLGKVHLTAVSRPPAANPLDTILGRLTSRRCLAISMALILGGLTLALLMAIGSLPTTLSLCLLGWALLALGGYRLLTGCGEL